MEKKLVSVLVATIENPNGYVYEQTIAQVEGEHDFSKEEKQKAIETIAKRLGKGYIICDVYEDYRKAWC